LQRTVRLIRIRQQYEAARYNIGKDKLKFILIQIVLIMK
jgi:hypothetical protein